MYVFYSYSFIGVFKSIFFEGIDNNPILISNPAYFGA